MVKKVKFEWLFIWWFVLKFKNKMCFKTNLSLKNLNP
jgi:hypothetical protein